MSSSTLSTPRDKRVRKLLSLDGGGVRGLSSILILRALMTSINRSRHDNMDPWQVFDLIGGTSTGGLLAIMLGRLRMSVQDCEKAYSDLAGSLFTPRHGRSDVVGRAVDFLKANGRFDETPLEENVKARIADAGLDENELLEDERRETCKVFIAGVKIWEAARATSAATTFFDPVEIGDHKELFADGALHYNNPMEMVLQEAKELWPNDDFLLLSIGTGTAPGQSINEGLLSVVQQLKRIATETEQTAQRFLRAHPYLVSANQFFRFNVYHGLGTIGLDESKELAQMAARTRTYLREPEVSWKMSLCVNSFLATSHLKDSNKVTALLAMHDPPLLKTLEPLKELNILILGETGVGKSTWINAFINYLMFDSLNEAMLAKDLNWIIPCSFATQFVDRSDEQCRFVQTKIEIGTRDDGSASASQPATVYVVNIGNTRVRLIDTPGIGDTRGIERDNQVMADILTVLRNYTDLHGILILLKPNAPRLTIMFRFCIMQLLAHLHRNAANNIVFGFTNARMSNYMPGDTFTPLRRLLDECQEAKIGLFERNVYCFDSESFRYLAAHKQGIDMGMLEDNRCSWQYSVKECKRLVKYFGELKPHHIQDTLDLNKTRRVIRCLTKPMVEITQTIETHIAVSQDMIDELHKKRLTRGQLRTKWHVGHAEIDSEIERIEAAIKIKETLIEELKSEQHQIQEVAVQFSTFLRTCSMISNSRNSDAVLEYLEYLIDQERMKVDAGGMTSKLKRLQNYRAEHEERVKVLDKSMQGSVERKLLADNGIRQLLDHLYGMKHNGRNLQAIVTINERGTPRANYREKAFNVKAGHWWAKLAGSQSEKD